MTTWEMLRQERGARFTLALTGTMAGLFHGTVLVLHLLGKV